MQTTIENELLIVEAKVAEMRQAIETGQVECSPEELNRIEETALRLLAIPQHFPFTYSANLFS